jgi:ubiquitin-conjugating enzyme E2 variant
LQQVIEWILIIILSFLAADFIAGVFHWWEDSYLDQDTPIFGRLIGGPNQLHHSDQYAFLQGSYWYRNYTTIIPSIVACGACLCFDATQDAWLTFLFLSQANQIHAWGHSKGKNGWLVSMAQRCGILQSCKHHAEHHRSPYHIRYCVMSPILNPILDAIGFWRYIEYVVFVTTRIEARA